MSMMDVPRCQHVKVNGVQCGSPALKRKRHCFFHSRMRTRHARMLRHNAANHPPILPVIEDANSVHVALVQVIQQMLLGTLEFRVAAKALTGLNAVSRNLKLTTFEPERVTDVVIDRSTVSQTCINGPQWIEEEFTAEDQPEQDQPEQDLPQLTALSGGSHPEPVAVCHSEPPRSGGEEPYVRSSPPAQQTMQPRMTPTPTPSASPCHSSPPRSGGEEPYVSLTSPVPPPTSAPLAPPALPVSAPPERPRPRLNWNDLEDQRLGIVRPPRQQASPETVKIFNDFCAKIDRSRAEEEAMQKAARGEIEVHYKKKSTLKKCRDQ